MGVLFTDELRRDEGICVYPLKPEVRVPKRPVISNLDTLLHDIYVRYIALKDKDFKKYFYVFKTIFYDLHERMKKADPYYDEYTSEVQYTGSHSDRLRINKPDEFDMNIPIRLPGGAENDPQNPKNIVPEDIAPGFVQLKISTQFINALRDGANWEVNQRAYRWLDHENYLSRSLFMDWFRSVVDQSMNSYDVAPNGRPYMYVNGIPYTLRLSASGPAITLIIEDTSRDFKLDVDLVPAIRFREDRFPRNGNYRRMPRRQRKNFLVVPKPMKGKKRVDTDRSWRLALPLQEKDLLHNTVHMRQVIRLIKKLRDSLGMDKIASYYIKTMFYHEAVAHNREYWSRHSPAELFVIMVNKFYKYMVAQNIPYFWNKDNNLIGDIPDSILVGYANILKKLVQILNDESQYKRVAEFLLKGSQFEEYRKFLHI